MRRRRIPPRAATARAALAAAGLAAVLALPVAGGGQERPDADGGGDRGGANLGFDPSGYQEYNTDYTGDFTFVRLMYRTEPWEAYRNPGWAHDYPIAERNFGKILDELTSMSPWLGGSNVLAMDDPELFRYPVAYLSEPGYWQLSETEAENLRAYLLKGGFLILDDMNGPYQLRNAYAQIKRILPDHEIHELDASHPVFDSFFRMEEENIRIPHPYGRGTARYFGFFEDDDPDGRLMIVINHDNDIGDYMEWSDRGFIPIALSNEAYKLGVNYVVYALTH